MSIQGSKNFTLLTDLYQLTMGEAYFSTNKHEDIAVFHLFYRTAPFDGESCIAAGLKTAIDILENFNFDLTDIEYLRSLKGLNKRPLFTNDYLNYLKNLKFTCSLDAVPEGNIVYPSTPLLRVQGPLIQCQLIETILLNIINFQTLIATKASRILKASNFDSILEFGLRRAQGTDGALHASRASYIGGVSATSNTLAGKLFDIPVKGTHAHSWIMSFDDELDAFMSYAKIMPHNSVLLVDTYDTKKGVEKAVIVADYLKTEGHQLMGIRLDSGDLSSLSKMARKILDDAGHFNVKIVASNDLDEYEIKRLKDDGALIDIWGVGTKLVTAYDKPALGGVYKLSALKTKKSKAFQYKIKLSNDPIKNSFPGILQVRRYIKNGLYNKDVLFNIEDSSALSTEEEFVDQLIPIFNNGKMIYNSPSIQKIREHAITQIKIFDKSEGFKIEIDPKLKKAQDLLKVNKS